MANEDIRQKIIAAGLKYWQVARGLNLNDGNFSRKLRVEMSIEYKAKIKNVISMLTEAKNNENNPL